MQIKLDESKRKYFKIDTEQNQLLAPCINQKKKPYETSHSGLSQHCLIFSKIKKLPAKDL